MLKKQAPGETILKVGGMLLLFLGVPPLLHQGNEDESQPKEEENNAA